MLRANRARSSTRRERSVLDRFVNLVADLGDRRFDPAGLHEAMEALDLGGITIERTYTPPERVLAWIDAEFGGTWSSEAAHGAMLFAYDKDGPCGFASFDVRGLRYRWLLEYADRPDVGVFGPFGVAQRVRKKGVGTVLLRGAMFGLRERLYRSALIPVVGSAYLIDFYAKAAGAKIDESNVIGRPHRRWRATVMASGYGGNFQSVLDNVNAGRLPLVLGGLVANRADAYALQRAENAGVPAAAVVWDRTSESRADFDARVLIEVEATDPDLVLMLGWMHLLPPEFVERFTCLNLHPAFLPLDPAADRVTYPDGSTGPVFRGAHAVDDALAAGSAWSGVSVHLATPQTDRGAVYARAPLALLPGEAREMVDERVFALERRVVSTAVHRWTWDQA